MSEFNNINNNKFNSLQQIRDEFNILFDTYCDCNENIVINIFNSENININDYDLTDAFILCAIGNYYKYIKQNYDEMKKMFLMAIELKHVDAMNSLGVYYQTIEINYDEMKKLFLMAIELKNEKSMYNLGQYYRKIKNYDEMKKLYLMAIDLNNSDAMYNLGVYYQTIEINHDEMKKYYLMAIKLNNKNENKNEMHNMKNIMHNLGLYYQTVGKNYGEMKKWYLIAVELKHSNSMHNLGCYYEMTEINYDEMKKWYLMAINSCNVMAFNKMIKFTTDIERFIILKNIKNKTEQFEEIYEELKNKPTIKKHDEYIQKYDESLQNNDIQECMICYENELHVKMNNCIHSVCYKCYLKIKICPYCRIDI